MSTRNGSRPLDDRHRFGVLVRTSTRLFRRILRSSVDEYGLSFNQYLVLREVYDVPRITQRLLSGNIGIAEPTIVATVDALIKRDYLVRERSEVDRRQTHLMLTRAGRTAALRIIRRAIEINHVAVSEMSEREAQVLGDLLVRANATLSKTLALGDTAPKRLASKRT
jgi:DNA-binding MarR family transcriptional regulator